MRYQVGAIVNGRPLVIAYVSSLKEASTMAESYFTKNNVIRAWVYDSYRGRFAEEQLPANSDYDLPARGHACVWERKVEANTPFADLLKAA